VGPRDLLVAAIWLAVASTAACGFDGVGSADVPAPATTPLDAGVPEAAPVDAAPPPPKFCDPSDATLILCLRFDGAIADESAHAQKVDVGGAPALVPGVSGSAVAMTPSTTLHVPHNEAWKYSALTVEMWVRPRALPPSDERAGLIDKNGSFGMFVQPNGDVTCTLGGSIRAVGAVSVGRWTHVACTSGGGKLDIWVDGRRVDEVNANALSPTTDLAAIGGDSPNGDPFDGDLDGVRVYSRAKSALEIGAAAAR